MPSSHCSPRLTTPSPQTGSHTLGVFSKPDRVSLNDDPVGLRSAWKTLIAYTLPGSSPYVAAVASLTVTVPAWGTCRPPRSSAILLFTNTQKSSSPRKSSVALKPASKRNQYSTSVVNRKLCVPAP